MVSLSPQQQLDPGLEAQRISGNTVICSVKLIQLYHHQSRFNQLLLLTVLRFYFSFFSQKTA